MLAKKWPFEIPFAIGLKYQKLESWMVPDHLSLMLRGDEPLLPLIQRQDKITLPVLHDQVCIKSVVIFLVPNQASREL